MLSFSTFGSCFRTNIAVWIAAYGSAYYFLYYGCKNMFKKYKFNVKYPRNSLVCKEVILSAIGIMVCSAYETLILFKKNDKWNHDTSSLYSIGRNIISLNTLCILLWVDAHFYFYHRLCHLITPLYKYIHYVHHESININPFSGLSFHPIESCIYFSSLFIVLSMDIPKWVFVTFKFGVMLAPLNGHSGHGNTLKKTIPLDSIFNSFDHYIHHALFNYNYGSGLLPIWDNLLGTRYKVSQNEYLTKIQHKQLPHFSG
eukprot:493781_1